MCDLWKNTTDDTVPPGAIPRQIDYALNRLPKAEHIKLYNSGNFFDPKAILRADYPAVAQRLKGFDHVIVENHPRLCTEKCLEFPALLEGPTLEVALGLETVDPQVLPALNKQMTLDDYARAVEFLLRHDIAVRSFILLKAPFQSEDEGVEWALRSIEYAFGLGAGCCAVIPTRAGNGIMDQLEAERQFTPPTLVSLEQVMEEGLRLAKGRVFVDLWDIERFAACSACVGLRRDRLNAMNLSQRILPPVSCSCQEAYS
jgi:radical SAM enzyme (TIGR01210 family)